MFMHIREVRWTRQEVLMRRGSSLSVFWWATCVAAGSGCDDLLKSDTGTVSSDASALVGFIGAPCETDDDCPYTGGFCLSAAKGMPGGMCSAECDRYCDDQTGHPTTFCVPRAELPRRARDQVSGGACISRCNYGDYTDGGCRLDYGCQRVSRFSEPARETYACLPGAPDRRLPRCYQGLSDLGVAFEADIRPPDTAAGSSRSCTIEDAVWLEQDVLGVRLVYEFEPSIDTTLAACTLGVQLAETIDELRPHRVTAIEHMGTYACRTVSGTSTLSRHAFGDAIDISGFQFRDGSRYSLKDDWEHNTTVFETDAGAWLYERGRSWHLTGLWSVVLTPNYNTAHDDHFHIDLTPGSHYWARETAASESAEAAVVGAGFFGPAPYVD
jgi:hypothetical protein